MAAQAVRRGGDGREVAVARGALAALQLVALLADPDLGDVGGAALQVLPDLLHVHGVPEEEARHLLHALPALRLGLVVVQDQAELGVVVEVVDRRGRAVDALPLGPVAPRALSVVHDREGGLPAAVLHVAVHALHLLVVRGLGGRGGDPRDVAAHVGHQRHAPGAGLVVAALAAEVRDAAARGVAGLALLDGRVFGHQGAGLQRLAQRGDERAPEMEDREDHPQGQP